MILSHRREAWAEAPFLVYGLMGQSARLLEFMRKS